MSAAPIPNGLLEAPGAFEVVRDQIASIIFQNQLAQQGFATAAAEDPLLWKLDVFTERAAPWDVFVNEPDENPLQGGYRTPVVNVWFDNGSFDQAKSSTQGGSVAHRGTFNIDVVGWGMATDAGADAQSPGDLVAARTASRGARQCREYLINPMNVNLQFRENQTPAPPAVVWSRWIDTLSAFQPPQPAESAHSLAGMRLVLTAEFNEVSPEAVGEAMEYISVDILRDSDGRLIAEADFDFS